MRERRRPKRADRGERARSSVRARQGRLLFWEATERSSSYGRKAQKAHRVAWYYVFSCCERFSQRPPSRASCRSSSSTPLGGAPAKRSSGGARRIGPWTRKSRRRTPPE